MASAQRFSIYPASFVHAGGTLDLQQLERQSIEPNPTISQLIPGGAVDPAAQLISHADPRIPLGTRDLATLLADVSLINGLCLSGAGTIRLQERASCGTFESGATHETFTTTGGFLLPESISAEQDNPEGAMASFSLIPFYDGTNEPVVHNTGVNFATAPAPAFVSQYYLGPCYHNSSQIPGVLSAAFETGIQFSGVRSDGDVYFRRGSITMRNPLFRIAINKVDAVATLSLFGRAITNSFAMYLRKGVPSGTRVADGDGSHIKISCGAGLWRHDTISVSGTDDATLNLIIRPTGTVTVSTSSTIP